MDQGVAEAVTGWNTDWNLVSGAPSDWHASAADGLLNFVFPSDGAVLRLGTAEGTINP